MTVRWDKQALKDLEEIEEHYLKVAPHFVDIFSDTVLKTTRMLAVNPYMGRQMRDEIPQLRQWLCYKYWIFYYVDEANQEIEIQNIIHTSRDI